MRHKKNVKFKNNSIGDPKPMPNKSINLDNYDKPIWFDLNLSKLINLPESGEHTNYISLENNIGLGNIGYNNQFVKHFSFTDKSECILVNTSLINTNISDIEKIKQTHNKSVLKLQDKLIDEQDKLETKIKTLTTKLNKNISKLGKVTICKKYYIYPDIKQVNKLHEWFDECRKIYDYCIKKYNENNNFFDKGYMSAKISIFEELYGNENKPVPYDILTDEIRIFCSNLKSCQTNLANSNIKSFEMKSKKNHFGQCIFIPKTAMTQKGLYFNHLGKMSGFEKIQLNEVVNDCRLIYNKLHNSYTLLVPINKDKIIIPNRKKIVAVDPGGRIFMAYFSPDDFGFLGYEYRQLFLSELEKIAKLQRILKRGYNNHGKKIRNKKSIIRRINMIYERMKNLRDELHHKIALFLCENYDTILIPNFETQRMLSSDLNYRKGQKYVERIYDEEGKEAGKEALREYKKRRRLNKKDKFVLNMLSHYRFRQHLTNKACEYGCKIEVVTEEYTSQTCTNCGHKSTQYNYREKTCENCNYTIDRDINGSRNILIKNISSYIPEEKIDQEDHNLKSHCKNDKCFFVEEKGYDNDDFEEDLIENIKEVKNVKRTGIRNKVKKEIVNERKIRVRKYEVERPLGMNGPHDVEKPYRR